MKKLSLSIAVLIILLGIPAAWLWYVLAGPGYYAEFNAIKSALEAMPGVEIVEMGGNQDLTYEDIWARIRVGEEGELALYALTRKSFKDSRHIVIGAIGPYDITVEGEGFLGAYMADTGQPARSQFFGSAIDIGRDGSFARFFPFQISNIQDVIARYDDIESIVADWPTQPDRKHFQDEEGTDYYYYLKAAQQEDGAAPSETPVSDEPLS